MYRKVLCSHLVIPLELFFLKKRTNRRKTRDKVQTSFQDCESPLSIYPPSYCHALARPNCKTETMDPAKIVFVNQALSYPTQGTK